MSPMRRAIETAYKLFSQAEWFGEMQFIILPLMRERIHTVCDIPVSFDEVKSEWCSKFPTGLDTSLMDPAHPDSWFIDQLDAKAANKISDFCMPAGMGTLAAISDVFPERLESA